MHEDVALNYPVNSLVSFHYFKDHDIAEMNGWGLRIIGDSGAFSAASTGVPVDIRDFAAWAKRWKESLFWVASLDVIGDAKGSRRNYEALRSEGIDVVPTIHYGSDPSLLDEYARDGVDFVGLGGMVGRKSEPKRLLRWTLGVFRYARDKFPQMRFHGWGVTHPELVMNLPWFSVDSSGFSSAYRFARMTLFDPRSGKRVGISLDGKDPRRHRDLLVNVYGVDPERVLVSTSETRRDLVRLSVAGVQRQEDFLRQRFNVSPPEYGVNAGMAQDGPNIHAAVGFPSSQATKGVSLTDAPPREAPPQRSNQPHGPRTTNSMAAASPTGPLTFVVGQADYPSMRRDT